MLYQRKSAVGALAAAAALCFGTCLLAQAPVNDDCVNAIFVNDGTNGPFDNINATPSLPAWTCVSGGGDVWFAYVATCNGAASADVCGGSYDTAIEVFDGTGGCSNLVWIGCNDDSCGVQSAIGWPATQGTLYYIRVGAFSTGSGTFPLNISCAPAHPNDECTNPVTVGLGTSGPFTNVGATTSAPVPPATTAFSCSPTGANDIWFVHTSTCNGTLTAETCGADYDSSMEVYDGTGGCGNLVAVGCNDDTCGLASLVSWPATAGTTYYIRVGGWSGATGNFPLTITCTYDLFIEGVAEATPNTGTLGPVGTTFTGTDSLRWNFNDVNSTFTGLFAAVGVNLGGMTPASGFTAGIPGLDLVWPGSVPTGYVFIVPPHQIGGPDFSVTFPPNFFQIGDTVRLQGLVLDPLNAPGFLPAVATDNTMTFQHVPSCVATEDFEGMPTGVGSYPAGWSDGGGTYQWTARSGGTPSGGTGPSGAHSGAQYMFCEASLPAALNDTFIMNSPVYPAAQLPAGAITFQLSRVGSAIGTLEVRMDDGSNTFATLLGTFSGSGTLEWDQVLLILPFVPANAQFQFHYTHAGNFSGDLAIDTFCTR